MRLNNRKPRLKRAATAAVLLAPADRAHRVQVMPDLTIPGHPDIFAVGDTTT